MQRQSRTRRLNDAIRRVAAAQHGVIAHWQLQELGLGAEAIRYRLATGSLHPIHRGVYAAGHGPLSWRGRWMAAVLASGDGAVLSHRSAAALWRIWPHRPGMPEVLVPRPRANLPGVIRRCSNLSPAEVTNRHNVPVTSVDRTLLDLAAVVTRPQLTQAFHEAEGQRLTTPHSLARALAARPGRRGNKNIRAVLDDAGYGAGITRSVLEARFTAFLRRHHLPPPERNAELHLGPLRIEADCVWREASVIVELDGREFHETASAFERDRERDRIAAVHGWTPVRVTARNLMQNEGQLARDLRALISAGSDSRRGARTKRAPRR
jgi:very-short-patch-repair endonuclease